MTHTLVLNASYEPLAVVSDRRALILVLTHKAILLEDSGQVVHSATRCLALPTVIRLARYVRVPHRAHVPLTRRALFARDSGRCVYCGNDRDVGRSRRSPEPGWPPRVGQRRGGVQPLQPHQGGPHPRRAGVAAASSAAAADRIRVARSGHRPLRPELGAVPLRARFPGGARLGLNVGSFGSRVRA